MPQENPEEGRKEKLSIDSDRLLLVEGRDEVNLFRALIRYCLGGVSDIQVIDAGGKDRFPGRLKAIRAAVRTRPTLQSIGVVRDADNNPDGAFQSIRSHLLQSGYEPLDFPGLFSGSVPSVGVFIVPDRDEFGSLETLCRQSFEGTVIARCVEKYMECLTAEGAIMSANMDKSFAHAYLAAMPDPMARVGEAAQQNIWNFMSPAFEKLCGFVSGLSQ